MNRPVFTLLAAVGATLSAAAAAPVVARDGTPTVVTIDSGPIRGASADGILSWKGVPFAAAPTGALRWRAPQPVAAWRAVRDATGYAHDCMQLPFPSDAAPLGTQPAEDCLYANVWRPAGAARKLPVLVWIYGGGFVNGGASPPTYAGANMAKQGVLFVSFNYRLGRFGSFAHPQLTRQDPDHGLLANYGFLDQIAALQWVRRNVAAFGGDPANVTIIGESAGGMSVHAMVTSPLAKGLFGKAIVMSGGAGASDPGATLAAAERTGVAFAAAHGIAADDPNAIDKLRGLSAETVVDGLNLAHRGGASGGPETYSSPVVDGKIAVDLGTAYASGAFAHVPMMIGATSNDIGGKTGFMIAGARQAAQVIAEEGVPVYAYRFSYVAASLQHPGADHASDIPFFFDNAAIKYGAQTTPRDVAMGRTISGYIARFAKTGDPNGAGLAEWPRYRRASDMLLDFAPDGTARPEKDPWGAEIEAVTRAK
ncbi:carboxylesterase family protein [Sphingomonas sp. CARO-RG-8B-R24-01]|uniref:carboxylesterase/lipase family protein n=1 Tax=Sphingomonas sp. CARO-RG-8B-R24-01 TaxID=2914831 RepID=UPI001F57789C|nr:carboxylesterase family protein [Sphingomonas sp. CARO-RG-8B-R24-01]